MWQQIKGYKTYVVALGAAITAIGAFLGEGITLTELVEALFAAVATATLRNAIGTPK